ncbi:MAG: hypothetical protein ABWY78_06665 [Microvirga sp.]
MTGSFRSTDTGPCLRVMAVLALASGLPGGCTPRRHDAAVWCENRDVKPSPERDACLAGLAARRREQDRIRATGEAAAMGAAIALQPRYR